MKVEKIKAYVEMLEKIFGDEDIVDVEMNEFVIRVGVTWDVFVEHLKAAERPECYSRLDKENNQLVLTLRYENNIVLVGRISV